MCKEFVRVKCLFLSPSLKFTERVRVFGLIDTSLETENRVLTDYINRDFSSGVFFLISE